jgi:hypothetical protein
VKRNIAKVKQPAAVERQALAPAVGMRRQPEQTCKQDEQNMAVEKSSTENGISIEVHHVSLQFCLSLNFSSKEY